MSLSGQNNETPLVPQQIGPCLSVIMPVYNERRTLLDILARVRAVAVGKEILLVDDGSTDGTCELLRQEVEDCFPDVRVLYHSRNRGKGAAIRTALAYATGDFVLIQDADLEYDPQEYPRLLAPLLEDRADVVFGSRFLNTSPRCVGFFRQRVANAFLTAYSARCTGLNLTDMEVCYKVFKREIIQALPLRCDRFDFEPEVTAKIARYRYLSGPFAGRACRICEVPVSYDGRDYCAGKKIGLRDALAAVWAITKYHFME